MHQVFLCMIEMKPNTLLKLSRTLSLLKPRKVQSWAISTFYSKNSSIKRFSWRKTSNVQFWKKCWVKKMKKLSQKWRKLKSDLKFHKNFYNNKRRKLKTQSKINHSNKYQALLSPIYLIINLLCHFWQCSVISIFIILVILIILIVVYLFIGQL